MDESTQIIFHVEPDAEYPIEQLLTMFHPNNSQVRNQAEMEAIEAMIRDEGFLAENIIVNPWNNKIISGHGRVQACWNLGYRGDMPVVIKEYPSEEEHRLAMLRWNRVRWHQDKVKEGEEIAALIDAYGKERFAAATAYTPAQVESLLGSYPESSGSGKEKMPSSTESADENKWPELKLQISPETLSTYQKFLAASTGATEGDKFYHILQCVNVANLPQRESGESTQEYGNDDWDGELWGEDGDE